MTTGIIFFFASLAILALITFHVPQGNHNLKWIVIVALIPTLGTVACGGGIQETRPNSALEAMMADSVEGTVARGDGWSDPAPPTFVVVEPTFETTGDGLESIRSFEEWDEGYETLERESAEWTERKLGAMLTHPHPGQLILGTPTITVE